MNEAEKPLEKLAAQMAPAQLAAFNEAAKPPARVRVATSVARRVEAAPPRPTPTPATRRGHAGTALDRVKEHKEQILAQAYRTAFGGRVPMDVLHAALGPSIPREMIEALT
jgi:hypothetical protein